MNVMGYSKKGTIVEVTQEDIEKIREIFSVLVPFETITTVGEDGNLEIKTVDHWDKAQAKLGRTWCGGNH